MGPHLWCVAVAVSVGVTTSELHGARSTFAHRASGVFQGFVESDVPVRVDRPYPRSVIRGVLAGVSDEGLHDDVSPGPDISNETSVIESIQDQVIWSDGYIYVPAHNYVLREDQGYGVTGVAVSYGSLVAHGEALLEESERRGVSVSLGLGLMEPDGAELDVNGFVERSWQDGFVRGDEAAKGPALPSGEGEIPSRLSWDDPVFVIETVVSGRIDTVAGETGAEPLIEFASFSGLKSLERVAELNVRSEMSDLVLVDGELTEMLYLLPVTGFAPMQYPHHYEIGGRSLLPVPIGFWSGVIGLLTVVLVKRTRA